MFTENEKYDAIYRGMNPAFVRRTQERRRELERAEREAERNRIAAEKAMIKERDRNALRVMRDQLRARAKAEKEARENARLAALRAAEIGEQYTDNLGLNHDMTVKEIITLIALEGDMTYDDMIGHSRVPAVVARRHLAIVEVYRLKPAMSLVQIGKAFGKDHSTIVHALQKAGVKRESKAGA